MKPEAWVIEDIGRLRKQKIRTKDEDSYLSLLLWYTLKDFTRENSAKDCLVNILELKKRKIEIIDVVEEE